MAKTTSLLTLLSVCFLVSFFYQGASSIAHGKEAYQKTRLDPRDTYLSLEAICGCEGMPYEFVIPKEKRIKTKVHPDDLYIDLDAMCGEGIPYKLFIPRKYIKTLIDYEEVKKTAGEELMSEDPTSLEVKTD